MFLIATSAIPSAGHDAPRIGYVFCSSRDNPLPTITVYSSPPASLPVKQLNCGDLVHVLERQEFWLRIASTDSRHLYVPMSAISQMKDRFVAFNLPVVLEPRPKTGKVLPRIIHSTDAAYTQAALKAGIHGNVVLDLIIEADGSVRDVRVILGLGYGLDESAVRALETWQFEPALQDGIPIRSGVAVEFSFSPPGKLP
jgi:TonB family protein